MIRILTVQKHSKFEPPFQNMKPTHLSLVCFCLLVSHQAKAANVLFFFQMSTYSHRITVWPLVEALADRGHNVTFHTIYHPKHPNPKVREFFPSSLQAKIEDAVGSKDHLIGDLLAARLEQGQLGTQRLTTGLPAAALDLCTAFLSAAETEEFIRTETFDLVVIDSLFNECGYGIAHRFGAKTIVFGTSHPFAWTQEALGVVQDTSVFTELHVSFQMPMTFLQKVISTLFVPLTYYYKSWFYYPKLDTLFRTQFADPNMPSIADLERNTSLVLFNSHFSEEDARSLPPMFVPIGGMHCAWAQGKGQKPLPKDIAKFIQDAGGTGFIYVSFGGELKLATTPPEFQDIFYKAFDSIKMPVLWKWDGPRPKLMPKNVFTAEWMPQQEILASPNCKLFITHGGLLGMQEAVSAGVPMIAMPVFAEQDFNSFRLERTGRGIRVEARTMTPATFEAAVREVLTDPKYKRNVEAVSKRFKDRPQTPLETAVFWTEYVLRHDDFSSMRPTLALNQYWFQRRLLDVWGVLAGILVTLMYTVYFVVTRVLRKCFCSDDSKISVNKRKTPKPKRS